MRREPLSDGTPERRTRCTSVRECGTTFWGRDSIRLSQDITLAGFELILITTSKAPLIKHPYGRNWRRPKEPLDESERGEWKSRLKAQHSENEDHSIWSHHFMGNRWGKSGKSVKLYFGGAPKPLQMVTLPWNWMTLTPWKKSYNQARQHIKKQRHYFANKVCLVKAMVFPVVMYGYESWTIKKA